MKRFIIAAVAVATLGAGSFALANSLTVTSDSLGSGSASVASPACSPAGSYSTVWNATASRLDVKNVTITATGCGTDAYEFVLTGTGGTILTPADHTGNLTAGAATVDISGDHISTALVTGVSVSVTGAS